MIIWTTCAALRAPCTQKQQLIESPTARIREVERLRGKPGDLQLMLKMLEMLQAMANATDWALAKAEKDLKEREADAPRKLRSGRAVGRRLNPTCLLRSCGAELRAMKIQFEGEVHGWPNRCRHLPATKTNYASRRTSWHLHVDPERWGQTRDQLTRVLEVECIRWRRRFDLAAIFRYVRNLDTLRLLAGRTCHGKRGAHTETDFRSRARAHHFRMLE